jgi:hypothetical protein
MTATASRSIMSPLASEASSSGSRWQRVDYESEDLAFVLMASMNGPTCDSRWDGARFNVKGARGSVVREQPDGTWSMMTPAGMRLVRKPPILS